MESKNPLLIKLKETLHEKIRNKNQEIRQISSNMNRLNEKIQIKNKEIEELEKTMLQTINNIETSMNNYSNIIKNKINTYKKLNLSNNSERGKKIFLLYRDLYNQSKNFFSNQEYNEEHTELIENNIKNTIPFFNKNSVWEDILLPINVLESQYKDMNKKYNLLKKNIFSLKENYNEKKIVFDILISEIEKIEQELNALKDFSSKITTIHK